jgi:hypothetical protein
MKLPRSIQLDERLAEALIDCGNSLELIRGLTELVDKWPSHLAFQQCLSRAYSLQVDPAAALRGWTPLVKSHPNISSLFEQLAEACAKNNDYDAVMATWWDVLKSDITRVPVMKEYWKEHRRFGSPCSSSAFCFLYVMSTSPGKLLLDHIAPG